MGFLIYQKTRIYRRKEKFNSRNLNIRDGHHPGGSKSAVALENISAVLIGNAKDSGYTLKHLEYAIYILTTTFHEIFKYHF